MCTERLGPLEEELFLAISERNYDVVKQTIMTGSRCNFLHRSGVTPLIKAVQVGCEDIVLALVSSGRKDSDHEDELSVEKIFGTENKEDSNVLGRDVHLREKWRRAGSDMKRVLNATSSSSDDDLGEEPRKSKRKPNLGDLCNYESPSSLSPPLFSTLLEELKREESSAVLEKTSEEAAFYPFRNVVSTMFSLLPAKRHSPMPSPDVVTNVSSRKRGSGSFGNDSPFCASSGLTTDKGLLCGKESARSVSPSDSCDEFCISSKFATPLLDFIAGEYSEKCDLNMTDVSKRTALHYAAMQGNARIVAVLIDAGARVNVTDKHGSSPLHLACSTGRQNVIKVLLKAKARVSLKNDEKVTPLHEAASRGHAGVCVQLLAAGASVDAEDTSERTPLYVAVSWCHHDAVEVLLRHGAKVSAANIHGETPLCEAVHKNDVAMVRKLLQHGAKAPTSSHLLHHAVRSKKLPMISMLMESGLCQINGKDSTNGDTPLHIACASGQVSVVEALIKVGASVNIANRRERYAMHCATLGCTAIKSFQRMCRALLSAGADVNVGTESPFMCCLRERKSHFANWLLRHGAKVCSMEDPIRVLELVRSGGDEDTQKLLIYTGFDIHGCSLPCEKEGTLESMMCAGSSVCFGCEAGNCWLLERKTNPLLLTELARIAYRDGIASSVALERIVNRIPFSNAIKKFILFDEFAEKGDD
ncbi:unnamed protein product [Notodromas monacha]|uniref:Uncharacterized protein n=1 Tax=Notodromas monacha TaxID=399045 RepID=A0A7R9BR27_9CRUS|nr:unnamed protein product [Notodromas monacha]CAG0920099.1 unnamed protein product [Notodromas monacha]